MPVNTPHRDYQTAEGWWRRCRDVIAGEDAIKARGTVYLPQLGRASVQDNASYRMRAPWYGAVERTIIGLVGAVFRAPPDLDGVPPLVSRHLDDATRTGMRFPALLQHLFRELLAVGRAVVQIDMTADGERPYWRPLPAESLISWRTTIEAGVEVLTRAVIRETVWMPSADDPWQDVPSQTIRVLDLVDGAAQETRYREVSTTRPSGGGVPLRAVAQTGVWLPDGEPTPLVRRGEPLDFLPLTIINPSRAGVRIDRPPLLDMVDLSLSLYRTQADLEWGAHRTALPTPVIIGAEPVGKDGMALGPGGVWYLPPGGSAQMLEFTGAGLGTLRDLAAQKVTYLAALGARLIEPPRRAAETAETVRLKAASDTSLLAALVGAFDAAVTGALRTHAWWAGASDSPREGPTVRLNRDFLDARLSPQEITALVAAWQAGAIPRSTLLRNLQHGEIIAQEAALPEIEAELRRERRAAPAMPEGP